VLIEGIGHFFLVLVALFELDDEGTAAALPRSCITMQMHAMLTRRSAMSVPGSWRSWILAQRAESRELTPAKVAVAVRPSVLHISMRRVILWQQQP
jgi:hypothetical protein